MKTNKYLKNDPPSPSDTLAQLVEWGASNAKVQGSNPGWSVIFVFFAVILLCGLIVQNSFCNLACFVHYLKNINTF